jgi:hypothetical protein
MQPPRSADAEHQESEASRPAEREGRDRGRGSGEKGAAGAEAHEGSRGRRRAVGGTWGFVARVLILRACRIFAGFVGSASAPSARRNAAQSPQSSEVNGGRILPGVAEG